MGAFIAGWDGGGTKTSVVCLTLEGQTLSTASFGPLNPNGTTASEVVQTTRNALHWMASLGECKTLVISVAGVSNPKTAMLLGQILTAEKFSAPVRVVGDQESALYGAVGKTGAVLVSGTGSICYGCNATGETARSGGYGYLADDEGSGYAIGRDILAAVLRASDGRIAPTSLSGLVMAQTGWHDVATIVQSLYQLPFDKAKVAALAPLIGNATEDPAAQLILCKAATELTLLATTVIDKLSLQQQRIAFTGSILTKLIPVRKAVIDALQARYPHLVGFDPLADAAHGAANIAYQWYTQLKGT